MANYYMLAILFGLALYIILFDTSGWKEKRSLSSKRKFKKVYIDPIHHLFSLYLGYPVNKTFFKRTYWFWCFPSSFLCYLCMESNYILLKAHKF